jgi:hypothetical protein
MCSRVYVCCCIILCSKQGIDADEWLNMGEKALTDDAARSQLLARMKVRVTTPTIAIRATVRATVSSTTSNANVLPLQLLLQWCFIF